jgi:ribosomal protein S18 acetylase RimI-like enzyme
VHPLDNPVWHALTGPQKTVAQGSSLAARYDADYAPFAGIADPASEASWRALHELVGAAGAAILFGESPPAFEGWTQLFRVPLLQMVGGEVGAGSDDGFDELGPADADAMLALVERTHPGPFAPRTVELGDYLGVRRDGVLVAMAGTRMRVDGYTEISAVCTDAPLRGTGLGTQLVLALVGRIRAQGAVPCLHVSADNTNAIRLYEALGFTVRHESAVTGWRAPT